MAQFLLTDFLNDQNQYALAEATWRERWDRVVREIGQEAIWQTPWLNTKFNDGTPFRDGNPIFSAFSPNRRLGVRVIQVEPAEDHNELSVWTDTFAEGEPEAIKELVIHCVLSDANLRDAEELITRWLKDEAVEPSRLAS